MAFSPSKLIYSIGTRGITDQSVFHDSTFEKIIGKRNGTKHVQNQVTCRSVVNVLETWSCCKLADVPEHFYLHASSRFKQGLLGSHCHERNVSTLLTYNYYLSST